MPEGHRYHLELLLLAPDEMPDESTGHASAERISSAGTAIHMDVSDRAKNIPVSVISDKLTVLIKTTYGR